MWMWNSGVGNQEFMMEFVHPPYKPVEEIEVPVALNCSLHELPLNV